MAKAKKKRWIALVLVLIVLAAAAAAAWFYMPKMNSEPVFVYGFYEGIAGMADYYEYGGESSGMVSTDKVQPVYLSSTQTVTEIFVTEGQEVKKGEPLFSYDTTLSDIALQRKALSVEQSKLDLDTAKKELAVINSYVPISYHPVETPEPTVTPEDWKELADLELEGKDYEVYKGYGDTSMTPQYCWLRSDAMVDELLMEALFHGREDDSLYVIFQHTEEDSNEGEITAQFGLKMIRLSTGAVTDENGQLIQAGTTSYRFTWFDPSLAENGGEPIDDGIDWNSGFTAAEIHSMRLAKQEQIQELEFSIKMGEAEYRIMQKEADDGTVEAEFDGIVVGLLDPESALEMGVPLMKVSGGGGYYVSGTVSELDLETISIGQTVDVMSWDSGMSYEGSIVEIQPFPQENSDYYYYGGSRNVSYYPYKVFIDESAMLQDGYYVSMTLRQGESEADSGSLYINNAFVLTEGASSYVYLRGEDGLLEKRQVRLGGMLWGEYSRVVSGITADDYVAFPYGKTVKAGAPTAEGTWDDLWGY